MKREKTKGRSVLARVALAEAVLAVIAITVSASESVQNWFVNFFAGISRDGLTREQVESIEENAQIILDSQTHNGWTVELNSAIRGEHTAYIVFRVEGPEDTDLSKWTDERGNIRGQIMFENCAVPAYLSGLESFFDYDEHVEHGSWGFSCMDDGDGKAYTANFVFHLSPNTMHTDVDAFGEETIYHFQFYQHNLRVSALVEKNISI